jgi:hypothetical protein
MANIRAIKNGIWSDATVWSPSAPTAADDVFAAGFTVFVDTNIQVISINTIGATGIGGGGVFRPNNGVLMRTNVVAGSSTCVNFASASPNAFSLVGNISGGNTSGMHGVDNTSTGTINITGNINGGTSPAFTASYGVRNNSTGTINIVGNVLIPNNSGNSSVSNTTTGTINLTGNTVTPPLNATTRSFSNMIGNSTGTVNIFGNVAGGHGTTSYGLTNAGSGTVTIVGNVSAGYGLISTESGTAGASNEGTGTIRVIGNVYGSQFNTGVGIINQNTGTIEVTGNVYAYGYFLPDYNAPAPGNSSHGIRQTSFGGPHVGTVRVLGNVYAGAGNNGVLNDSIGQVIITGNVFGNDSPFFRNNGSGAGVNNNSTGTVTIFGNAKGGIGQSSHGVQNQSTGTVIVSGSAIGGRAINTSFGAFNNSTGILRVKRAVGNDFGLGYADALSHLPGVVSNVQGSRTFVEELECGPRGAWPTGGVIFFTPNTRASSMFETDTFQAYNLVQSNSADNLVPPVSSVRQGTVYDLGMDTGTCIIPPASSVGFGVSVDNTTGTATLVSTNVWNISASEITDSQSIGGRLKNTLTANAAEKLIGSFSS